MASPGRLASILAIGAAVLLPASTGRADDVNPAHGVNHDRHRVSLEAGAFTVLGDALGPAGPLGRLGYQFRPAPGGPDLAVRAGYLRVLGSEEGGVTGFGGATVGVRPFLSLGHDDRWELGLGLHAGAYRGGDWFASFAVSPDLRLPLAAHTSLAVSPELTLLWHPGDEDRGSDEGRAYGGFLLSGSVGVVQSF